MLKNGQVQTIKMTNEHFIEFFATFAPFKVSVHVAICICKFFYLLHKVTRSLTSS
jgi:hypothetical protein